MVEGNFVSGAVNRFRAVLGKEEPLFFIILFYKVDEFGISATFMEIVKSYFVYREKTHGCAVFRRHIGNRCPVWQAEFFETCAEKFDKTGDNTFTP